MNFDEFKDVKNFHQKFGLMAPEGLQPVHLTQRKLGERVEFMQEELDEFKKAVESQDMAGLADALVDLVYVAKGTAVMMNLPWNVLWAEVQRANMDKVRGMTKRGHPVDVTKPEGWQPPHIDEVLGGHQYKRADWCKPDTNIVDEEKCHDDQPQADHL